MLEKSKYNNNKLEKNSDQESINDYQSTPSSITSFSVKVQDHATGRPVKNSTEKKMPNSIDLQNTETEEKPLIYLFIFVNPLSGDRKGMDLIDLPIQHFRLRRFPCVQVEIHNILDDQDRTSGVENIQLIQSMVSFGKIPSLDQSESSFSGENKNDMGKLSDAAKSRHIHVWSAGGDGTVMSVFELLVSNKVELDLVFFSCIPFGTGNDFSQVVGWGRTIPKKDIVGSKLSHFESLISERLEHSEAARLDIWQIKMTSYPSGYVREAGPKERKDGHDVAEVKEANLYPDEMVRKMSNYMSIGVQGYVGSGFEAHRAGNRWANMLVYAQESFKWVFWKRFPDLNRFIQSITQNGKTVLECPVPEERKREASDVPQMTNNPIDFVIQNIPHIWGHEVDLWGEAQSGLESVSNRSGPTDPKQWKPQRANDGRLELMTIENMISYLKKLANIRHHVSRLAQLDTPFEINFYPPEEHEEDKQKPAGKKTKRLLKRRNKYEKKNKICIMCDGEFYEMKDPKSIQFDRFAQIWTLGRKENDDKMGRLVKDELDSRNDDP